MLTVQLKFNSKSKIYVLDDQEAGRELWRLKLDESKLLPQTNFAADGKGLGSLSQEVLTNPEDFTLLFDYDLGSGENGLSLLEKMPVGATRCLVTGNFDNDEIRDACSRLGVLLVPKSQISEIPFVVR